MLRVITEGQGENVAVRSATELSANVVLNGRRVELTKKEIMAIRAQLNDAMKDIERKEEALFLAKNLNLF